MVRPIASIDRYTLDIHWGFCMNQFTEWVQWTESIPGAVPVLILVASLVAAIAARIFAPRIFKRLTRRTETDVDDRIAAAIQGPIASTIFLAGVLIAGQYLGVAGLLQYVLHGAVITLIALMWAGAAMRAGSAVLDAISNQVDRIAWIEPKTLPLFDMLLKVLVVGGLLYVLCIAWNIPLTSWITSAGIVGIAVGFAARDTLANLFSGVFIVADAPYKLGDYIVLDGTLRGIVSDIGIRSTRLLTRDDVEVTVPNAVIANAQIVNETGGPHEKMRVRVKVSVAYGSDLDQVEQVLLSCAEGVEKLSRRPEPRVRFRAFGESGLDHELLAWIDEPVYRGRVLHELNRRVYKSLNEAGIEIPYNKLDVFLKEQPVTS
jgi:small-conductance mechanosensitive channel